MAEWSIDNIARVRDSCEKTADSMRQVLSNDNELLTIFKEVAQRLTQLTDEIKGLREDMYPKIDKAQKTIKKLQPAIDPVSVETVADEHRKEIPHNKAEEAVLKNPQPGDKMPDGTIYLGQYEPKDRDGVSLRKIFNVFAAPEDLPGTMTYVDVVKHVAALKKWNGYEGADYATDRELYAAIKSGSYNGGWIIPTRDILHGKDIDGKEGMSDNMLKHRDKGAFKDTYKTTGFIGYIHPNWYWSSTEHRYKPQSLWTVQLTGDQGTWLLPDPARLGCRLVRLVEVPARSVPMKHLSCG